ncbi:MAG: hypothetical protein LBH75_08295 [Treponema sp.]|jgi:hypothetical protein|nr:hypothetical protein [Treponema sp.]
MDALYVGSRESTIFKDIIGKRALKEGVNELRLIQNKVSKVEMDNIAAIKDIAGVKTYGKIISTVKQYVRIQLQDRIYPDGIYRAYPNNFNDKTLAIEHLPEGIQVGFTIRIPSNNENECNYFQTGNRGK